jgi:hypothetical protein
MTRGTLIGALAIAAACGFFALAAVVAIDGPSKSAGADLPELKPANIAVEPAATGPPSSAAKPIAAADPVQIVSRAQIVAARKYARSRGRGVSFAVIDSPAGRPRGLKPNAQYPSASVSKAMLMVAVLRRAAPRQVSKSEHALLKPMITKSDNDAAATVYRHVGPDGMKAVARAARMQRFGEVGYWASERLTAADQARFFYRIDDLVPERHRGYARALLSSVVPSQRWGIARVAERRGYKIFFKGGWRPGVNHQIALLEKNGQRFALAVMTNQSGIKGRRTEEGIANKILR